MFQKKRGYGEGGKTNCSSDVSGLCQPGCLRDHGSSWCQGSPHSCDLKCPSSSVCLHCESKKTISCYKNILLRERAILSYSLLVTGQKDISCPVEHTYVKILLQEMTDYQKKKERKKILK